VYRVSLNGQTREEIDKTRENKKKKVAPIPPAVKKEGSSDYEDPAPIVILTRKRPYQEKATSKNKKDQGIEKQVMLSEVAASSGGY
jgi:hypothetical protein